MAHHDHSHEHVHRLSSLNRAFVVGILLNSAFVVAEFTAGILSNSMGLLSDAGHNLSDVASLLLAMLAFRLAQVRPTSHYTYGYRRSTILVSLLNAVILLVAVGAIVVESVRKLIHPEPVGGEVVLWVAGIGVVINLATALMFLRDKERDLNVKGAYLHMAADALVSVGVMVSGALLAYALLMPFLSPTLLGCLFGVVAGIMVFISLDELLPAAEEYGEHHISIYGVVTGMAIMAVSLILFT